ncbi:hypothetical protein ONS95_004933 [Cadophora gregata]|uniref:uncharacterized protein n=1 Tax=Cadophora gregata TaxID=51156 RepID=UPI0026DAE410|nr:uncharacterized protein ONS95_004933 [Cadophora gregata]KAK0104658.1 hypothetical protein ONS95_004933 [Cadophora gregata]KAK0115258.1 hypothetical protein ONS96_013721 [Cadophora gregata f. sp. sojae]
MSLLLLTTHLGTLEVPNILQSWLGGTKTSSVIYKSITCFRHHGFRPDFWLLAFLPDDHPPTDPTETRLLQFSYTPEDTKTYHDLIINMSETRDTDSNGGRLISAKRHIRRVLVEARLRVSSVERTEHDEIDFLSWTS